MEHALEMLSLQTRHEAHARLRTRRTQQQRRSSCHEHRVTCAGCAQCPVRVVKHGRELGVSVCVRCGERLGGWGKAAFIDGMTPSL